MTNFVDKALHDLRGTTPPARQRIKRPSTLPDPVRRGHKTIRSRSEAELCDLLGAWIAARGFEVFYEVPLNGGRPDVVGIRDDQTLAIEAKLHDVAGVIRQGWRIVHAVDLPYVALPLSTASEVIASLDRMEAARLQSGRAAPAMPGVLAVGHSVREMRRPTGAPRRRVAVAKLRDLGERFGAEHGGVPNTDQSERNIALWRRAAAGESSKELARSFSMNPKTVRQALRRIAAHRIHLTTCSGPKCFETDEAERQFYAVAHRRAAELLALPDIG